MKGVAPRTISPLYRQVYECVVLRPYLLAALIEYRDIQMRLFMHGWPSGLWLWS